MIRFPAFFRIIILRAFSCVLYTISLCQQEFNILSTNAVPRISSPNLPERQLPNLYAGCQDNVWIF